MAGTESKEPRQRGDGGSSDDDRQPEDTGATGTLGDLDAERVLPAAPGSHHDRRHPRIGRRIRR